MSDYSVRAVLSAVDKGFTTTMSGAQSLLDGFSSKISSGLGFGILTGIGQTAFSTIYSGLQNCVSGAISTSDAMNKLQQAMRFSGSSEEEIQRIAGATGTLKTYADKTVFSLNDVMSTFGSLSANGIKDADKMTEAVGNAVAVFGGGAQEFSSVGLAYSQAMASGALHAQDWNQILNASPQLAGGLRKELIKLNPALGEDFKGAMENGAISADMLGQAMNNIGMTEAAEEAATSTKTMEGAIGNLEATVQSGVVTLWDSFAKSGVVDALNTMNAGIGDGFDWLANTAIPWVINAVGPFVEVLKGAADTLSGPFATAFEAVKTSLSEINGEFGTAESASGFQTVVNGIVTALTGLADFATAHSDEIAVLIAHLPQIAAGIAAFKIASAVAPAVMAFASPIMGLAKAGLEKIAPNLFTTAAAEKATGTASATSATQVLQAAVAFLALGAGVALICVGFSLLISSAIQLATAGPIAVAVLLLLIGTIALLAVGASLLGPALTVGAVGFVAFGIAIALVGVGALLAALALTMIVGVLPGLITYAAAGAVSILILSGAISVFALAAAAAGLGAIILGAGLLVATIGVLAFSVALIIADVAILLLAAVTALLGAALLLVGTAAMMAAMTMTMAASGALMMMGAFVGVAAISLVFMAALMLLTIPLLLLGATAIVAGAGMAVFALAIAASALGAGAMALALTAVSDCMHSIASDAASAEASLNSMESAIDIVGAGLEELGNLAGEALNFFVEAFSDAEPDATAAATSITNGINTSLQIGLATAPIQAQIMMALLVATLNATAISAYTSGQYIGEGLANGMLSKIQSVRDSASQLAAAAQAAIDAKAQIGSPSKLAIKSGKFIGEGLGIGIGSMTSFVKDQSDKLFSIPNVSADGLEMSLLSKQELNSNYKYNPTIYVQTEVKSIMDGREVGRGSAKYVKEQNDFSSKRKNRLGGAIASV